MKTAMGRRRWVELRNREPMKLISAGNIPFDLRTASGTLIIRGAQGIEPVIEVELKGSKPLLGLGSGVTLKSFGGHVRGPLSQNRLQISPNVPQGLDNGRPRLRRLNVARSK